MNRDHEIGLPEISHTHVSCEFGSLYRSSYSHDDLLRAYNVDLDSRRIVGFGFNRSFWRSRLAAEGEFLERVTWRFGYLWNSLEVPDTSTLYKPTEALSRLDPSHEIELTRGLPCVEAKRRGNSVCHVPATLVFAAIDGFQDCQHDSVTTGWAYYINRKSAMTRAMFEVIERDAQILTWMFGFPPGSEVFKFGPASTGLCREVEGIIVNCSIEIDNSEYHGVVNFSVAFALGEEPPFLSAGAAVRGTREASKEAALNEMIASRCFQYELELCGETADNVEGFTKNLLQASRDNQMRDNAMKLINRWPGSPGPSWLGEYCSNDFYYSVFTPPKGYKGFICRAWLEGCQPMVPLGHKQGWSERLERAWKQGELVNCATEHPFP